MYFDQLIVNPIKKTKHTFYSSLRWLLSFISSHVSYGGSDSKVPAYSAGDLGSNRGSGRSPGERNGNPLRYSCLENPMDRGACWATVHGVVQSRTRLSDTDFHFTSQKPFHKSTRWMCPVAPEDSSCPFGSLTSFPISASSAPSKHWCCCSL